MKFFFSAALLTAVAFLAPCTHAQTTVAIDFTAAANTTAIGNAGGLGGFNTTVADAFFPNADAAGVADPNFSFFRGVTVGTTNFGVTLLVAGRTGGGGVNGGPNSNVTVTPAGALAFGGGDDLREIEFTISSTNLSGTGETLTLDGISQFTISEAGGAANIGINFESNGTGGVAGDGEVLFSGGTIPALDTATAVALPVSLGRANIAQVRRGPGGGGGNNFLLTDLAFDFTVVAAPAPTPAPPAVPEPSSLALLGFAGLMGFGRRRRRS